MFSVGTHPASKRVAAVEIYKSAPRSAYIRKDQVTVPAGLAPGNYVLSWRWDIATADGQVALYGKQIVMLHDFMQVWLSCSNVKLV